MPNGPLYFYLFTYEKQPERVQAKIEWVLGIIEDLDRIPQKYFKHIEGTKLYEIRIEFESNIYRVFSFFDKGNLIILGNAFQKKTRKTPKKEINKANKIRKEYFDEKD